MVLAVDIGNTNIVIGVFNTDQELLYQWRISSNSDASADEYLIKFYNLFRIAKIDYQKELKGCIIASVVPELIRKTQKALHSLIGVMPMIADEKLNWDIINDYDHPRQVGVDRLLNSLAAKAFYGLPALVIDFGTATTIDVVSSDSRYLGGTISPGIQISSEALFERTAKLPHISLSKPTHTIGKTTVESMRSGILLGAVGQITYLIDKMKQEYEDLKDCNIILTGGLSNFISPMMEEYAPKVDSSLTLKGLNLLFLMNQKEK